MPVRSPAASTSCAFGESVFRQQPEPLAFGQVAGRDDLEVTPVQGGDFVQAEPLGKRYDAGVDCLKPQGCGVTSMSRNSSSAIAAQNSAARPTRPRRWGSASR